VVNPSVNGGSTERLRIFWLAVLSVYYGVQCDCSCVCLYACVFVYARAFVMFNHFSLFSFWTPPASASLISDIAKCTCTHAAFRFSNRSAPSAPPAGAESRLSIIKLKSIEKKGPTSMHVLVYQKSSCDQPAPVIS
jgi:hypothetical protein